MSQESNRYLITKIHKRMTTTGKPVIDLYGDPRLKYPVLTLFDIAALTVVGIDPNNLPEAEHYARFFAYYQESEKTNKDGNHYKDVLSLEPCDEPQAASPDTEKILTALRILYKEIEQIRIAVQAITSPIAQPAPAPQPTPAATVDEPPLPSLPENEARQTFYALLGPAIAAGTLSAQTGNDLATSANGNGWNSVLAQLQARLK